MLTVSDKDSTNIIQFFDELPDPRSEVNRGHLLGDVIVIAICAVLAGCDGPTAIAKWAVLARFWYRPARVMRRWSVGSVTGRHRHDASDERCGWDSSKVGF